MGEYCEPDIRGNYIESNRKAGIKLTELAVAHIGGTAKEDMESQPTNTPVEKLHVNPVAFIGETLRFTVGQKLS